MFKEDLRTKQLWIEADQPNWGGPACVKIAMMMYPSSTCPMFTQKQIAGYMAPKVKEPSIWAADPYSVTQALNGLCPPPNGTWYDISKANRDDVLWKALGWMTKYKYPPLLCLPAADHWIAVVYYESSDDPTKVKSPVLGGIGYFEPSDHAGYAWAPAWMWASASHWGSACPSGALWKGKWIGVAEPPETEITFEVEEASRFGRESIEPEQAIELALEFVARNTGREGTLLADLPGVEPRRPILTSEIPPDEEPGGERAVRYYLVPFGYAGQVDHTGGLVSELAVMVNATTSQVEGFKEFLRPVRYLDEAAARRIAGAALRLDQRELDMIRIESISVPWSKLAPPANPAWSATFEKETFYVTHEGSVVATLDPPQFLGR